MGDNCPPSLYSGAVAPQPEAQAKELKKRAELRFSPVSFWMRVFPFFGHALWIESSQGYRIGACRHVVGEVDRKSVFCAERGIGN